MPTPVQIAQWMLTRLNELGVLYQEDVVWEIQSQFGDEFVYENQNGNLSISRNVLSEFRKLTDKDVVWERGERAWRRREPYDLPGRRLAD